MSAARLASFAAAQSRSWRGADFDRILLETQTLPGQAYVAWQSELAAHGEKVRAWAEGLSAGDGEGVSDSAASEETDEPTTQRNPAWSRDELILALDLYVRFRRALPGKTSKEVAELSGLLGRIGRASGRAEESTYRNVNGVYMKMMNFRRFDPEYTTEGKVGLIRGNKEEESVWAEFSSDPVTLAAAVATIRGKAGALEEGNLIPHGEAPYWVFVCNPKRWAVDKFLGRSIEHDTWGVRPSDRDRFAPGQLGVVRVGVDRRSAVEREGKPPLEPGIYALCQVESEAFDGSGANDEFWTSGEAREAGWPTVKLRYLRAYLNQPLTIERLRAELPDVSPLLLNGFQAASFPIPADDFRRVVELLGGEPDDDLIPPTDAVDLAGDKLAALERKYLHASPEVKRKLSKVIERRQIGSLVKRATGFKCQVCEVLGRRPIGFLTKSGEPYVEAHHVTPVSKREIGSLSASNVMTVCANHHRQMHYGGIDVMITPTSFEFEIDGAPLRIARLSIDTAPVTSKTVADVIA
jgi:predicted HNH restriction endonuclease